MPPPPQFKEEVQWESLPWPRLLPHAGHSADELQPNSHIPEAPPGLAQLCLHHKGTLEHSDLVNARVLVLQVAPKLQADSICISCEVSVLRPWRENQFPHLLVSLCY